MRRNKPFTVPGALSRIGLRSPWRTVCMSALAGASLSISLSAVAGAPDAPGLFSTLPDNTQAVLPPQALAGKSLSVNINFAQLRNGRFLLTLPGGVSFEAIRDLQQDLGRGRSSWTGHASDDPESRVVLGVSGDAVVGTFAYRGKLFKLEPRADGSHLLSQVETTDPAPELDPIPVADAISSASSPTSSGTSASTAGQGAVIDVLVAYTPAVRNLYGTQGAQALAIQAIAETNQAYANSGMTTRLNLRYTLLTNYVESGDMATDLGRLRATRDGYMDELHRARDLTGADLVTLIEDEPQYCGIAYRMATLSASFATSAFSVEHHGCASAYYALAHEIGHNQGAHHDYANAPGSALFPYAYGFQDPSSYFHTIMAYDCPAGCSRISYFSSPGILYNGLPIGDINYAANANAIDQTAPTVAAFRQQPATPNGC